MASFNILMEGIFAVNKGKPSAVAEITMHLSDIIHMDNSPFGSGRNRTRIIAHPIKHYFCASGILCLYSFNHFFIYKHD